MNDLLPTLRRRLLPAAGTLAGACAAAIIAISSTLHAQNDGKVTGTVRDAETSEALSSVTIQLREASSTTGNAGGTVTSANGTFQLANLKSGRYTLAASIIGYKGTTREVVVKDGETTRLVIELTPEAIQSPGVGITASRERSYISNISSTATKTSTPLRDIPASIQVVPAIVMKDQGASTLDQTIRNVSGIAQSSQSNYGFFNNYTVRGLRQRFLRDGVPDGPTTNGYARSLTDVDRVEVLKGPGSAIYGSSEPGGSINLVSKPAYGKPALVISQTGGSFGFLRTTLDGGGSFLTDDLRSRVSAAYSRKEGYRDVENSTIEVLPSFTYSPSSDNTFTASIDFRKIEQDADTYGIPYRGTELLPVDPESDYHTPFSNTKQTVVRGAVSHTWQAAEPTIVRTNLVVISRDLYLLRNAGSAIAAKSDTMTGRRLRQQTDKATDVVAQIEPTFKVTTGPVAHTILTGAEYLFSKIAAVRSSANLPNITDVLHPKVQETSFDSLTFKGDFDRDITLSQVGAYLQDQITITEQIKARLGVRWDLFGADDVHKTDTLGDTRSDSKVSGQVGLVFQPITELSIYGGMARGHLSTVSTESNRISEPESSTQYELGTKASLLEGQLQLNVAAFHVIRDRFNVTIGTEQLPVGQQRTQGLELDMSSQPTKAWGVTANYAYYDAKITNNPADTGAIGKRPVGVPENTASVWTTYTIQSGALEGFGLGGGLTYRDAMFLDAHNTRSIDSYVTGDATIFYRTSLLEAQVNIINVGNTVYFRNGVNSGALPGEPRNFQATVRLKL